MSLSNRERFELALTSAILSKWPNRSVGEVKSHVSWFLDAVLKEGFRFNLSTANVAVCRALEIEETTAEGVRAYLKEES